MDSLGHEPFVSQHPRPKFEHVEKRAGVRHLGSTGRSMPTGTRVRGWKMRRRKKARRQHLRDTPIRQDRRDL